MIAIARFDINRLSVLARERKKGKSLAFRTRTRADGSMDQSDSEKRHRGHDGFATRE